MLCLFELAQLLHLQCVGRSWLKTRVYIETARLSVNEEVFGLQTDVASHALTAQLSRHFPATYKVIHIICLSACIAVRKGIMGDKVYLVPVDEFYVQHPGRIFHNLVHPSARVTSLQRCFK